MVINKGDLLDKAVKLERAREKERKRRSSDPGYRKYQQIYTRIHSPRLTSLYKEAVINVYTNGEATCRRCGNGDIDVLCLDHVNDDGNAHRREVGGHKAFSGMRMYRWVVKNDYPSIFQVLCANCNLKKEVERRRTKRIDNFKKLLETA
jgi:hypothetical protein